MSTTEDTALRRTIAATLVLGAVKLVVALVSHSQAMLASAVDSLTDGVVSALNLVLLRQARRPADEGHPFGHGKVEALAALAQGVVLAVVVVALAWSAAGALVSGEREAPAVGLALVAMVGSLGVTMTISSLLSRAAERTRSLVLKTDAVHYRMDLLSGVAVILGLLATWLAGVRWADPVASLVVCVLMGKDVVGVLREAIDELMDRPFPPEEVAQVEAILRGFDHVQAWHDLRTRKSGPFRFVQVHVELPHHISFAQAHDVCDRLETALRNVLPQCDAIVHADPAGDRDRTDRAHQHDAP